jgi:hypothetical protein
MTQEPKIFPYIERLLQGTEVVWKLLGEVAEIKTGQSVSKNIIAENAGDYPVINSGRNLLDLSIRGIQITILSELLLEEQE